MKRTVRMTTGRSRRARGEKAGSRERLRRHQHPEQHFIDAEETILGPACRFNGVAPWWKHSTCAGMDALREALPSWAWSPLLLLYTNKDVIMGLQPSSRRLHHVSENCEGDLHIDNGHGALPIAIIDV